MPNVELDDFFESPSEPLFDRLTKDQLCQVAAHYQFDINLPKGFNKQELKESIKSKLVDLSNIYRYRRFIWSIDSDVNAKCRRKDG
jgi:hypothetical protein